MSVVVVVDGSANLNKSILKKYDIVMMPYNFKFFNGDIYSDIKLTEEFDKLVNEYGEIPSFVEVDDNVIEERLRKYIDKGDDILYICSSSSLYSSYDSILSVASKFSDAVIEVVDSENLLNGEALLALYARDYINKGYGLKQCVKYLNSIKKAIKSAYLLGDVSYVYSHNEWRSVLASDIDYSDFIPVVEVSVGKLVLTFNAKSSELVLQMFKNMLLDNSRNINYSYLKS